MLCAHTILYTPPDYIKFSAIILSLLSMSQVGVSKAIFCELNVSSIIWSFHV